MPHAGLQVTLSTTPTLRVAPVAPVRVAQPSASLTPSGGSQERPGAGDNSTGSEQSS